MIDWGGFSPLKPMRAVYLYPVEGAATRWQDMAPDRLAGTFAWAMVGEPRAISRCGSQKIPLYEMRCHLEVGQVANQ